MNHEKRSPWLEIVIATILTLIISVVGILLSRQLTNLDKDIGELQNEMVEVRIDLARLGGELSKVSAVSEIGESLVGQVTSSISDLQRRVRDLEKAP